MPCGGPGRGWRKRGSEASTGTGPRGKTRAVPSRTEIVRLLTPFDPVVHDRTASSCSGAGSTASKRTRRRPNASAATTRCRSSGATASSAGATFRSGKGDSSPRSGTSDRRRAIAPSARELEAELDRMRDFSASNPSSGDGCKVPPWPIRSAAVTGRPTAWVRRPAVSPATPRDSRKKSRSDSESVEELVEEGQAFEAGIISGVEDAPNADEGGVRTRQVPVDDVPQEYLDED